MTLLVTGDSHCGPIHRGLLARRAAGEALADIRVWPLGGGHLLPTPFFRDAGDHAQITADLYRARIPRLPPEKPPVTALAFSMPLWPMRVIYQLFMKKQALVGFHGDLQPVSQAVFRQIVLAEQAHVLALFALMQRIGLPVAALSGPGLFRDHGLTDYRPAGQILGQAEAYRAVMLAALAERGIPVLDIPAGCRDAEGFMLARYRSETPDDPHHANAAYGALVVAQLEDWRRSLPPPQRGSAPE
ncbi:hypothetical protein [Tropicibacter sp. S64]|uniref:hypothetical protein n=1 Tax=Tropicibacter sp. S64 TaxID=3415122 RepID=UPI003C79CB80